MKLQIAGAEKCARGDVAVSIHVLHVYMPIIDEAAYHMIECVEGEGVRMYVYEYTSLG